MPKKPTEFDSQRRRVLTAAAAGMGVVGSAYVAVPFVLSMDPSAKALAAGAPLDVDISKLKMRQMMTVKWRGKPVWILRRDQEMLDNLVSNTDVLRDPDSNELTQQPPYAKNNHRSIKREIMVMVGICTHLGCAPTFRPDVGPQDLGDHWKGGFFCPCHGSRYDLAGRVYKSVPAPSNLVVPQHRFVTDNRILVGVDPELT